MTERSQTTRPPGPSVGRRLDVRGQVQGVGFRPYVYRLACELGLTGCVGNDLQGAFIELEGKASAIEAFQRRLIADAPPLVRIDRVSAAELTPPGRRTFVIETSTASGKQEARITPDTALCDDCLAELLDPTNRRYRYPFINCTNCGPRYSIIQAAPYDRPNTTMSAFTMCPVCQGEYDDPADRRFHAQPNACGECGPRVWLTDPDGATLEGDAITLAGERLQAGLIVAVKGLGGFHLACRADDDQAVARLRRRKRRESKPLAMMVDSLESADRLAEIDPPARSALTDPARPIVLTAKRPNAPVSRHVAPGTDMFGLMLPYTPLHVLLLAEAGLPLVMTSGNPTDEPLCCDNDEAVARLSDIADAFLLHNRDIERRVDDSVVMAVGEPVSHVTPIRRARGYVPAPIAVPAKADAPVLAVGGELKSAVCLLADDRAVMSEHLGELPNAAAYRNFLATIDQFKKLLAIEPTIIAHDLHPGYAATRHALTLGGEHVAVQHHHAHIVGCLAENGQSGRAIGLACDGTGYGTDGAVWGGETLLCDEREFQRVGHLRYVRLFGADTSATYTWRPALAWIRESFPDTWQDVAADLLTGVDAEAASLAMTQTARGVGGYLASSTGRLFDAAAFLLGLCERNRHEAEAAMAVEAAAREAGPTEALAFDLIESDQGLLMDARPMIREIVDQRRAGRDSGELARSFHETLCEMFAACATRSAETANLDRVALSGGCFANRLLLTGLVDRLLNAGLRVFTHRSVPTGDGGLALGQAVVAAAKRE